MARLARRQWPTRRAVLQGIGAAGAASVLGVPFAARAHTGGRDVFVQLLGGLDGLTAVPAYGDPHYAAARGALALAAPGRAGGALDLDGFFGLHPAMPFLHDRFKRGEAAILHAVSLSGAARGHVAAQAMLTAAADRPGMTRIALGGWDTHARQGAYSGTLAARLAALDRTLEDIADWLGPDWRRSRIVVASEFGRNVAPNAWGGTDHGDGGAAFALGGGLAEPFGGRVVADWPGLSPRSLRDGRDLLATTDLGHALSGRGIV